MTGIRICYNNGDGTRVCLLLPPGGPIIPRSPFTPGQTGTTTVTSSGGGTGGDHKPGSGNGLPIFREHLLTDLSLIGAINIASSSIADEDARVEMNGAIAKAIVKMQEKVRDHGLTIEVEK